MADINVLPREVYELIAAGEVIERPASIVKELIENSIDAGADSITVEIKNGGRTFIRVADNGRGIPFEQVPTAFLRHATSKVAEKDDLNKIMTLGFRGEALASVCAVARVEMLTKTRGADLGTRYVIASGEEKTYEQAGCPEGTSVMVRDLFYNVPARLKFLKKDATEGNRIQELMSRLAVSHPDISIKLIRDNKPVFVTAGDGKLYSAIYSIFGREFANSLMPAEYEREGVTVTGFICKPLSAKPNRKFQVFYVNDRYVRSEVCSQALEEAYKNSIMVGKFPMCVLKLSVSPSMIDVNVHPAKTEVRFSDNRYIYDAVYFAAKQGLEQNDRPYELKIEQKPHYDRDKLYVDSTPPPEQIVFADPAREQIRGTAAETGEPESGSGDDLFLKSLESPAENAAAKPLWEGMLQPAPVEEEPSPEPPKQPGSQDIPVPPAPEYEPMLEDDEFSKLCQEFDIKDSRIKHEDDPAMEEPESFKETAEIDQSEMPLENFEFVTADDFKRPARV
ncbi:MAG: DNA mismatch repair endonuclease MutL, partial [Ruminococcus sp.]|nr:DNA mismatch repair endonuclease MutL [Ruminococcus sp.]